jgi:HSP20 family protein
MTDATAIPINIFENDREVVVTAPMPGVAPTDIAIEVTADGKLTLRANERGLGQERIEYQRREWSYGPYTRTVPLPCCVDAPRANVAFDNGVLSVSFPKAEATSASTVRVDSSGHARGVAVGHAGGRRGQGAAG